MAHRSVSGVATKSGRSWGLTLALSLAISCCAATDARSAQGGKAEPLRIEFARGRDSATVRGTLRGDAQREYALVARKGQRFEIAAVATPEGSIDVQVRQPDGMRLPLAPDHKETLSAVLPDSGEYFISVNRVGGISGRSQYTLTVTIR